MTREDEVRAIDALADRLRGRFPNASPEQIERTLLEVYQQYDGRPIREFIPVLVEREAIDRLRSGADLAPV